MQFPSSTLGDSVSHTYKRLSNTLKNYRRSLFVLIPHIHCDVLQISIISDDQVPFLQRVKEDQA